MGNPTATLEREDLSAMKLEASQLDEAQLDEAQRPRAASMKFTHASGSRPLEGFTIKRGVGRGGFGEVYFATSDAGKEVALKLIRRNLEVELRGVTQCLNLKHPNLVGLYDIRTDDMGDQWVIMEFVSGESLEEAIDRHPGGMPIEQALWWMRGMCAGVAYLHDHGVVHRDLKPGNIFCDEGTVKIGDYGLAKFISCSRRSGQTESVGTVHYMAPEIANGRYGREIDTYALGIILFEVLTGRVPFEGESVGEVLMKHLTAEPDLSILEEPYRDIVRRALAKDPEVRLKSVGEMVALLPGSSEETILAPNIGPAQRPNPRAAAARREGVNGEAASAAKIPIGKIARDIGRTAGVYDDSTIEEPIWKAVRTARLKLQQRWTNQDTDKLHPLPKALLIFAFVGVIVTGYFGELMEIVFPLLILYGIYYVVWTSMVKGDSSTQTASRKHSGEDASAAGRAGSSTGTPAEQQTVAWRRAHGMDAAVTPAERYAQSVRRRRLRPNWRERANQELAVKPLREKFSELLGSMLLAAAFAIIAALAAPLLLADQSASERIAAHLWLATVGTLGSWAILVPTKFAEGKVEDQVPMRITMLSLGAVVGVVAWLMGNALMLETPHWGEPVSIREGLLSHELLELGPTLGVNPPLAMYITYFAFLFLLLRWWRQAEFTRGARLSLWTVLVCVFWAWLLQFFWWFPQPTGMMAAAVIAISTQLASPWLPPSRRRAISAEMEEAMV
jgi:predicted outer membrane lipoprotein